MHIITVPTTPPATTAPATSFPAYYLGRPVAVYQRRYRRRAIATPQPS